MNITPEGQKEMAQMSKDGKAEKVLRTLPGAKMKKQVPMNYMMTDTMVRKYRRLDKDGKPINDWNPEVDTTKK